MSYRSREIVEADGIGKKASRLGTEKSGEPSRIANKQLSIKVAMHVLVLDFLTKTKPELIHSFYGALWYPEFPRSISWLWQAICVCTFTARHFNKNIKQV